MLGEKSLMSAFKVRFLGCFAASLFSFFNLFLFSLMNVLGTYLLQEKIVTPIVLGFLSSWDLWGNVLGFIPVGILIDRYGSRCIGLNLFALAILATFIMSLTKNLPTLCLMRFFQGLASSGSLLITMRLGSNLFPHRGNITIGCMIMLALSGGMAGNTFFAWISSLIGWQHGLKVVGIVGLLCWLIMWHSLKIKEEDNLTFILSTFLKVCKKDNIIAGIHIGLLNSPVFLLGSLFGNTWLMHKAHLTLSQAASLSSLLFIGITLGSPLWGFIADKIGSIKVLIIGYMLLFSASFLLTFNVIFSSIELAIIFFSIGFVCCIKNIIYPFISRKNLLHLCSTAMGTASIVSNSMGGVLQIIFGLLMQVTTMHNFSITFFPIIFLAGLGLLTIYKLNF
jgi:MFS family permease